MLLSSYARSPDPDHCQICLSFRITPQRLFIPRGGGGCLAVFSPPPARGREGPDRMVDGSGFKIREPPSRSDQIFLEATRGDESWHIVLRPQSPLASSVQANTGETDSRRPRAGTALRAPGGLLQGACPPKEKADPKKIRPRSYPGRGRRFDQRPGRERSCSFPVSSSIRTDGFFPRP